MRSIKILAIVAALLFGVDSYAQMQQRGQGAPQGQMRGQARGQRQQMKPEDMAKAQADNVGEFVKINDAQKKELYDMFLASANEQAKIREEQMKIMQQYREKYQVIQKAQDEKIKAILGEKAYEKYQKERQLNMQLMQQRMQQLRQTQAGGGNFEGPQREGGMQGGGGFGGGDFGGGTGF